MKCVFGVCYWSQGAPHIVGKLPNVQQKHSAKTSYVSDAINMLNSTATLHY